METNRERRNVPPLFRQHRATVAVAALFAGTPSLATAAVIAEPALPPGVSVPDSGRDLIFEGGRRLGVRCLARPSVATMTIPAETTVRVVNRTGLRSRLLLDGVARGELAGGAAVDVLFHHGPVTVGLHPICVFTTGLAVRVEVGPPPDHLLGGGTPNGDPLGGGVSNGDPLGGGTPGQAAAGRLEPSVSLTAHRLTWASGLAAEPIGPIGPVRDDGPTGLLALVAAICVVGVSAGAVRAIIAQRTTRTVVS